MSLGPPPPLVQANPRLLIVDDEPGTVRLMMQVLEGLGEIFFATGGQEALAMVARLHPDIVLLDAEMPGMDGFQVCRDIKADPDLADLPILFVTAGSGMESETRALEAGAVDFILKPLSPPIVRARVKTHLALKQRTDELRRLAAVDGLTGVANRREFDRVLLREWRRAWRSRTPLSLAMVDIDHFKEYNDFYGHQDGDACLRAVSSALSASCRRPGDFLARYGGEEFAAILPECDHDCAMSMARRLMAAVETLEIPHAASPTAAMVTVSVGTTTLRRERLQQEPLPELAYMRGGGGDMVRAADMALYQAKCLGRRQAVGLELGQGGQPGTCPLAPLDK
jgi:diguanylate cyclase (GGDEF)-like protein